MKRRLLLGLTAVVALATAGIAAAVVLLPVNLPVFGLILGSRADYSDEAAIAERLELPDGYDIAIHAAGLGNARLMQIADDGSILVSVPRDGVVRRALPDSDGDGRADGVTVLAADFRRPHGLLLEGRSLIVAEVDKVTRVEFDAAWRETARETVLEGLPSDGGHSTRTVARGPDGALYVSAGSSCNVCVETHPWRAAIIRLAPGSSAPEIFATGLRNTVGFDWQPGTGALYGVENSRDWLGDDFPPDELNRIERGGFYGWPYFHGDNVPDPDLEPPATVGTPIPPAHSFAAHVAPLSIRFLRHQSDPAMARTALVAQHGSWNRSTKIGYRVVALHWADDGTISQQPFITGFERGGTVIGRPVDIAEAPDGTIYVSDDFAGVIYRVTRRAQ